MARRVFLHIGTMKAATTYLQNLFDANETFLASHGIAWHSSQLNQNAIHDFQSSGMLPPDQRGSFDRLRQAVRSTDGDVVISMELLAKLRKGRAQRLVEALGAERVEVILTAREMTRVATSHWQETTQNRGTTPWTEWIDMVCSAEPQASDSPDFWRHHYLPRIVETWGGVGPVHLVTIPQGRSDPGAVWRRFSSVLGVPSEGVVEPSFNNASLGATSAELMRRVNEATADLGLTFPQYRWGFKAALAKQTLAKRASSEPKPALTAAQHEALRSLALGMVEWVEKADVDVVGDLADLVPPAEPSGPPYDPAQATDAELLEAAIAGLTGLGVRVSKQHVRLQRRSPDAAVEEPPSGSRVPAVRRALHEVRGRLSTRLRRR
ncbi:MAG TPA: hypothetical protein VK964_13545 [Nocardioidaceae bacterium]|nr:hypothetical protein [Nocardioidaceae bacterium]